MTNPNQYLTLADQSLSYDKSKSNENKWENPYRANGIHTSGSSEIPKHIGKVACLAPFRLKVSGRKSQSFFTLVQKHTQKWTCECLVSICHNPIKNHCMSQHEVRCDWTITINFLLRLKIIKKCSKTSWENINNISWSHKGFHRINT